MSLSSLSLSLSPLSLCLSLSLSLPHLDIRRNFRTSRLWSGKFEQCYYLRKIKEIFNVSIDAHLLRLYPWNYMQLRWKRIVKKKEKKWVRERRMKIEIHNFPRCLLATPPARSLSCSSRRGFSGEPHDTMMMKMGMTIMMMIMILTMIMTIA